MPKIRAGSITMNYDQQGSGEPLVLIPYLAADYACYAFQVADYSKHFTCVSVDLRGTGESDKPDGISSKRSRRISARFAGKRSTDGWTNQRSNQR